jgi:hypothetical protein
MDPGEGGFMAEEDELELDEFIEDLFLGDAEFEDVMLVGGVVGALLEEEEKYLEYLQEAALASDADVDAAIDLIASETKGYCRLKGLWKDNPALARHLYRKIYTKD